MTTEPELTPARLEEMQECFERALELDSDNREEFLRTLEGRDTRLAATVRGLLRAHLSTSRDLKSPVAEAAIRAADQDDGWIGARVGVYRVVRRIGAGGMGTVYEASREDDQFRHRVAIKFLHRHAGSEAAHRRFRDERQILASLQHPHIAALLDGGVTADHQPYFVMEYLEGEPITRWCDERQRSVAARLELFLQVCSAVQYAHQSLVVHRDLKPGNILVTPDGVVKLLDFGIAKLLRDDGEDATATQAGARAYTPNYASPEQLLGLPVGTRSDVYALGVVLYELLTGTRPFELAGKSVIELERLVSSATPAKPSAAIVDAHVANLGARSIARARTRVVGDLDAIVLKALRTEPERRYGSAEELAAEVRRHLEGLPVQARPESMGYRLGKLIRRHRMETAAIGLAVASLVGGIVATSIKASEAIRERERVSEVKEFLTTMLGAANPASFGRDVQVRVVLDSAVVRADALKHRPELEGEIRVIIGGTYLALGEFELGEAQFRRELAIQRELSPNGSRAVAMALGRVSAALEQQGRYAEADSVLIQATAQFDRFIPLDDPARADHLDLQGRVLTRLGRMAEAEPLLAEALDIHLRTLPVNDSARGYAFANLGMVRSELGRNASAESLLIQAVAASKRAHGEVHPLVAAILSPLATVQERAGAVDRADSTFREALAMREKLLGPEHPDYAWTMFSYADHLLLVGRNAESAAWCRKVLALRGKTLSDAHPAVSTAMSLLGRALGRMDSLAAGGRWLRESLAVRQANFPKGHWLIASSESILGEHLVLEKRYAEAEQRLLASEQKLLAARGEEAPVMQDARNRLVRLYEAWGRPAQAEAWRARLRKKASG
ncbi:MAG: serine/threonine protein kinase [Gemmatimonadales bacterium]|nr:serine/threonine protein kinase [Gemmatimonadales bacterium]